MLMLNSGQNKVKIKTFYLQKHKNKRQKCAEKQEILGVSN